MRISDWSSDMCSSDLAPAADRGVVRIDDDVAPQEASALGDRARQLHALGESERQAAGGERGGRGAELAPDGIAALAVERLAGLQIALRGRHHLAAPTAGGAGRPAGQGGPGDGDADRERDVWGKRGSVRVDTGGRG